MKRSCATLLALVAAVAVTPAAAERTKASLRLTSLQPVTVRGTAFAPRERVRVELTGVAARTRRVVASPTGAFTVRFADVTASRCDLVRVTAVGSAGGRATLKHLPAPLCPPA